MGDKNTFGKGTVQTILEIGRFTSLLGSRSQEDGALKLTIQKFYRVAGGSTQLHGVTSDIVLPSLSDLPEFGEGALKNCLPYDEVPRARFTKWSDGNHQLFVDELKRRSDARIQANPEFRYVMEDMERLRRRLDENHISLNEDVRRKELNEDKLRKEARSKERLARADEVMCGSIASLSTRSISRICSSSCSRENQRARRRSLRKPLPMRIRRGPVPMTAPRNRPSIQAATRA